MKRKYEGKFSRASASSYSSLDSRSYNNVQAEDRRLDSLSRVLAPAEGVTKCVAITVINGKLIIGANKPKVTTPQELKAIISRKYEILRDYLSGENHLQQAIDRLDHAAGLPLVNKNSEDRIKKDLLKLKAMHDEGKLKIEDFVVLVPSLPECQQLIPSIAKERENVQVALTTISALLDKLDRKIMNHEATEEDIGEHKDLLKHYTYYRGLERKLKDERSLEKGAHAEQLVIAYAKKVMGYKDSFYIGISKLCCDACMIALKENNIRFRGSHGGNYPTYSVLNRQLITSENTDVKKAARLNPEDSDSEIDDFYDIPESTIKASTKNVSPSPETTILEKNEEVIEQPDLDEEKSIPLDTRKRIRV